MFSLFLGHIQHYQLLIGDDISFFSVDSVVICRKTSSFRGPMEKGHVLNSSASCLSVVRFVQGLPKTRTRELQYS